MSLKAFHIVFIIFSTGLAFGSGMWCLWVRRVSDAPNYLFGAIFFFAVALALIVFG